MLNDVARIILIITVFSLVGSCSVTKIQRKGYIAPDPVYFKYKFSTIKSVIVLPVQIDGENKSFLFDTGADVTLIQSDSIKGSKKNIGGATNRNMRLGNEIIKSIRVGGVEFVDTYVMSGDFVGLKEQIPNFGGLIGQPIICKANWLIDYPNKIIEISNLHLIDSGFKILKIKKEHGAPYITLSIDGSDYEALIDLGSSSAFSIPEHSILAQKLLKERVFLENEREIYTIGGLQSTKEKTGCISTIYVDGIEFKDVEVTIRPTSQLRVGNDFFKDCVVYIDNANAHYSIKMNN